MMEKVYFESSDGVRICGVYYPSQSDGAVVFVHGSLSNKDRLRFVRLAEEISKLGVAVLRIDLRGSGESTVAPITIRGEVDDLRAAMTFLRNKGHGNIGIVAESLGALVACYVCDPHVKTMVFWAPLTKKKAPSELSNPAIANQLRTQGYVKRSRDGREFIIPRQYYDEMNNVNQEELLGSIACPVLIVHGDADDTVPLAHSESAMRYLSKDSSLKIISGGSHTLHESMDSVIPLTVAWFKEHLSE